MGIYNTFWTDDGGVQVKCHDSMGGWLAVFEIGDIVPTNEEDEDGEITAEYGENHNIFDYTFSGKVVFVRNNIYTGYKDCTELILDDVKYLCIDKYGRELDLKTPNDYVEFKQNYDNE